MVHGIRFSSLSVLRTNYIVPGALFFLLAHISIRCLNSILFVLIRPFFSFFLFLHITIAKRMHKTEWLKHRLQTQNGYNFISFSRFASYAQEINRDDIFAGCIALGEMFDLYAFSQRPDRTHRTENIHSNADVAA